MATVEGRLVWFGGGFIMGMLFLDGWTCIWQYSPLRTEPSKSYWVYLKTLWWYLGQQYINEKEVFSLVPVLSCLPLPPLTFLKTMLKCSKSSTMRCNDSMRRSSSLSFNCKRQQKPVIQSVRLRKPGEKQRPKLRKRPKNRGLWRRRSWSIFNDSGTRC